MILEAEDRPISTSTQNDHKVPTTFPMDVEDEAPADAADLGGADQAFEDEPIGGNSSGEGAAENTEFEALVDEAKNIYGLPEELVDGLGDNLSSYLAILDKQAAKLIREQESAATSREAPAREPEREPAPKTEPAPPTIAERPKFELPLDRDNYDEGTLKAFDTVVEQINSDREFINQQTAVMRQMAQLLVDTHGAVTESKSLFQSESEAAFANEMDGFFTSLGDEFAGTYGKETLGQLTADSPKLAARNALIEEMRVLREADKRNGRPARSHKEQAQRALRVLNADKLHVAARKEVEKQITTNRKAAIARPSGRTSRPVDRRAKALATIQKMTSQMGL